MSIQNLIPHLEKTTRESLCNNRISPLSGGDINTVYRLQTPSISWFIKINRPALAFMFEAEAKGLKEIANSKTVKVPKVITFGQTEEYSYLVLEYIHLNRLDNQSEQRLGEQLAAMHQYQQPFFGWHIDNTIGSIKQHNNQQNDWVKFWRQQRLLKQLQFAANNGFGGKLQSQGEKLAAKVDVFFNDYQPHPVLLHGDLWGANAASTLNGQPLIYDPACYYGDRETDIAMTELFGGFSPVFYQAYQNCYPLDSGYQVRKTLYNLYHILNHLNLFGRSYLHQAESMIMQLLAET